MSVPEWLVGLSQQVNLLPRDVIARMRVAMNGQHLAEYVALLKARGWRDPDWASRWFRGLPVDRNDSCAWPVIIDTLGQGGGQMAAIKMKAAEICEAADLLEMLKDIDAQVDQELEEDGVFPVILDTFPAIGKAMLETGRVLALARLRELGVEEPSK
jgi:hypothetical protein